MLFIQNYFVGIQNTMTLQNKLEKLYLMQHLKNPPCVEQFLAKSLYCYTLFYTAANVHSTAKQLLQIIHTSLAHRKSFHIMPSERWIPAKVFMLGLTGTNEPQMGR